MKGIIVCDDLEVLGVEYVKPNGERRRVRLHPNPCKYVFTEEQLSVGKEVEFRLVTYCLVHNCEVTTGPCTLDCAFGEVVYAELTEIKECEHQYSKAFNQPHPRLCVKCGEPEPNKNNPMNDIEKLEKEIQAKNRELAELKEKLKSDKETQAIKDLSEFTPEEKILHFDRLHRSVMSTINQVKKDEYMGDDTPQYMWEELMGIVARDRKIFWKYFHSLYNN